MYEIKEKRRILNDGTEITTYSREVVSCNILEVEARTTGYKGGDTGHGGRTYFSIKDAGVPIWMFALCVTVMATAPVSRLHSAATANLRP